MIHYSIDQSIEKVITSEVPDSSRVTDAVTNWLESITLSFLERKNMIIQ